MDNLLPIFTLKLKHKIHPGLVTIGKYDGVHPCLTCGTTASKVFVHNPHGNISTGGRAIIEDSEISLLSINQAVTALTAGRLDPSHERDVLCIGTQTNILAYDVHNNTDLFYKEVLDGVNSLQIGHINQSSPLVIAGGNCTLQGYDAKGEDQFWTVTGDMVSSIVLMDFNGDGENELIVGSEDYDIRIFSGDAIQSEINESEAITHLCKVKDSKFGYALANGTIGVYDGLTRLWRIKSKQQVMSTLCYDIDGDGVDELITGWSSGKVDARSTKTGDVIFKDTMSSAISGLVSADYRLDGSNQLICCSVDGEIRGFKPPTEQTSIRSGVDINEFKDLNLLKKSLLMELENYERENESFETSKKFSLSERIENTIIPANTSVRAALQISADHEDRLQTQLIISTNNDTTIRMVVLFAEGLFNGESHVVHPPTNSVSNQLIIKLFPTKDIEIDLHIQAFVGLPVGHSFHVFELTKKLPTFSSYLYINSTISQLPESYVQFTLNERVQRVALWINENFLLPHQINCDDGELKVQFIAARGGLLTIEMASSGQIKIRTDDMEVAGLLIQSLSTSLSVQDLPSTAHFPAYIDRISETMGFIDGLQSDLSKISAEMRDQSNLIKSLIVKSEDSRILEDMASMKKGILDLQEVNRSFINIYKVRSNNHQKLVNSVKMINQFIQQASNLRVGKFKTQTVSLCREAIKNKQIETLCKIIQAGSS